MTRIPRCFFCKHYKDDGLDNSTYTCAAFPEGIPKEMFTKRMNTGEGECDAGYHFDAEQME